MSTELTISTKNSSWSPEQIELIKNTVAKGCTNDEFKVFLHACERSGLDPFMRQIYAVKYAGSMTIQTAIDGYRLMAERTGKYAPGREPTYQYNKDGGLISCTAYVRKMTPDGTWHEVAATAFWDEYVQLTKEGKPTKFWYRMRHIMLAKCAEALALRKAFPGDFSGIYTKEEMMQAKESETLEGADIEVYGQPIEESEEAKQFRLQKELDEFYERFGDDKNNMKTYCAAVIKSTNGTITEEKFMNAFKQNPTEKMKSFNLWMKR